MRNPFAKPEAVARHLKLAVTGKTGTGKTVLGLDARNHGLGPVFVISTEAGDVHYIEHYLWGGFQRLPTQSLSAMSEALDYLEANPSGTLVVDTVTGLYEALIDAKMKDDGSVSTREWGLIKRKWKSIMARLNNLPMNIVDVVHENDIVEHDEKKGTSVVVGQKLDVEKSFERNPDVVIRLGIGPDGARRAVVLKDRTMTFKAGDKIDNPHLGMWAKAVKTVGAEARIAPPEEVKQANAAAMATKPTQAPAEERPEPASSSLAAMLKVVEEHEAFGAEAHANNWWKKHRAEIEPLTKAEQGALWRAVQVKTKGANGNGKEAAK